MAPPVGHSKEPKVGGRKGPTLAGGNGSSMLNNRDVTPRGNTPGKAIAAKPDAELSTIFKSDMTSIKDLVTCSICDQLLYEPWTLGCGHTYCYTCLCSWFLPNKYKKSCPECRTAVSQLPAPAFLVKQIVELFTKRVELMPSDESVEQHKTKRLEETAEIEKDKNGPLGLFKGTFPKPGGAADLRFDDEDGVHRCSACGHEHEGGPTCQNCGVVLRHDGGFPHFADFSDVDDDDEADMDAQDLAELEMRLGEDVGDDLHYFAMGGPPFIMGGPRRIRGYPVFHHHPARHFDDGTESLDGSSVDGDSEEDGSSLNSFVVRDEDAGLPVEHDNFDSDSEEGFQTDENMPAGTVTNPVTVDSDNESDEGGAIRRPGRLGRASRRVAESIDSSSPIHSTISVPDSCNSSEAGDFNDEASLLREAGWSPLDPRDESDAEGTPRVDYHGGFSCGRYDHSEDEHDSEDESDTETMVGQGASDDDEDEDRERSETPRFQNSTWSRFSPNPLVHLQNSYDLTSDDEQADDDDSDAGMPHTDQDGDTEMSVSPSSSRGSRSVSISTDGYGGMGARGVSVNSDTYGYEMGEDLGVANQIHDVEDNSSESSIIPAGRRRPRRYHQQRRQQYNPRVSMMFAEHQNTMRRAQASDASDVAELRVEPASRSRRMPPYRVSNRTPRTPRQYSVDRRYL